jgi:uncharacterized protein YnzC (UPF0291/DUF896 family)
VNSIILEIATKLLDCNIENNNKAMKDLNQLSKKSNLKGVRLNWTPIEKVEQVKLRQMNISGKKVSSNVIQRGKKFVDSSKRVLIP